MHSHKPGDQLFSENFRKLKAVAKFARVSSALKRARGEKDLEKKKTKEDIQDEIKRIRLRLAEMEESKQRRI